MVLKAITDISLKKENQDNYWCARLKVNGDTEVGIVCVCDGMGGLNDGARASKIVVERIREYFLNSGSIEGVGRVLESSNEYIKKISGDKKSGTTCTVLICMEGRFLVYNIGDSRCYHIKTVSDEDFDVTQITGDHTVIEKYRREGKEITPEIVRKYKNILTRCIGVSREAKYDVFEGEYSDEDYFLVCSDGFWHTLEKSDFSKDSMTDLEERVMKCKDLGESDNITACILMFK